MNVGQAVSPLLLQRYELKYMIPMDLVEPISRAIEGHCVMDYYSSVAPDKFYTINSLYFDTFDYKFLIAKREGADPSFCMRVRSYGDFPRPPYYTEMKIKQNDFTNKLRARIDSEDWVQVLRTGEIPAKTDPVSRRYIERFIREMLTHGAEPKILTQYRRKAYLSTIDAYARVTFDRDLRYQAEEGYNVVPHEGSMSHYDHEELFIDRESHVILELKCEKKVPFWLLDIIRRFDLSRCAFSKYGGVIVETTEPLPPPADFIPAPGLKLFR